MPFQCKWITFPPFIYSYAGVADCYYLLVLKQLRSETYVWTIAEMAMRLAWQPFTLYIRVCERTLSLFNPFFLPSFFMSILVSSLSLAHARSLSLYLSLSLSPSLSLSLSLSLFTGISFAVFFFLSLSQLTKAVRLFLSLFFFSLLLLLLLCLPLSLLLPHLLCYVTIIPICLPGVVNCNIP